MLLTVDAMMHYKSVIELVFTSTAKVSSMFFQDTQGDVINSENDSDAEHRFAKYDDQHYSCVPFAGFQQRRADHQVTEESEDHA